ncbi:hypothetical protein PR048_014389 [Dryococelus australis]|uniref:Uncharacterized protein n=1 Tax=Dryococelus australis TaxID=614101 RepID=A0ABQ9HEV5_9NEOP|nr:hypothetical protein PR048_014389 [Dryococelus australis]
MSDNKENVVVRQNVLLKLNLGDLGFPETWKSNVVKRARHRSKGLPKMQDIRRIRQKFYLQPHHEWQNNFLLQHVSVVTPKISCTSAEYNPEDLYVQYDYYRTICNQEFNIGFGSPCVDKCLTCCQLDSKISAERSNPEKTTAVKSSQETSRRPSFIPPDRIFGHLERELLSHSVIGIPDKYMKVIRKRGTVTHLGEDCPVKDWKTYAGEKLINPATWHFQFQKAKKIVVTKSKTNTSALVRGEPFYNFESMEPKSLCKRGKTFRHTQIPDVPKGLPVKSAKLCNVKRLLVLHFGEE